MARSAGEILSSSRLAMRSHSALTRLLSATPRTLLLSTRQEPAGSFDLSTAGRSAGGHLRWYSLHIQRDSVVGPCHFSAAACSSAMVCRAAADSCLETVT